MQRLSGRWQLGFWLALTTAVLWGAVPLAMTPLIAHLDAVTISWFRFASSGLCLLAFFAARGRLQWPRSAGRTAAWLFALAGRPDLSAQWVDWVAETYYSNQPDGLAGNDDGGTLSAWYALTALGLYPLSGTDRYVLGPPRFDHVEIPAGQGVFTVTRDGHSSEVTLDGAPWLAPDLRHAKIKEGGALAWGGGG